MSATQHFESLARTQRALFLICLLLVRLGSGRYLKFKSAYYKNVLLREKFRL
jgi:hypothetical protein